jgi:hypothetical protein
MKRKIFYGLGAILVGALTLAAVANGPYYALPAWTQKLACAVGNCLRFIELADWSSAAVLDRETGLVWEKSPSTGTPDWFSAQSHCNALTLGNRKGWRLPTLQELVSLVDGDPANTSSPRLPPGHPFTGVQSTQSSFYWSANTRAVNTNSAWGVGFLNGGVVVADKSNLFFVWCVRGGQGVDPQ